MVKKRSPTLAALLSLLMLGLGHIYVGSLNKGLSLLAIEYTFIFLAGAIGILSTFYGIIALIILTIGLRLFAIIDSVRIARRNKNYALKSYNRWYWYIAIFATFVLISIILSSFRSTVLNYETYRMPFASMSPTLQAGDFITVNTKYPHAIRGDVVVFLSPKNRNTVFTKRVIAVGSDHVSIKKGIVIVNGQVLDILQVKDDKRQKDFSISMAEIMIPEGQVFLLGDWRDNSNDSRYWGTVPTSDIIGKVTYIWFSPDINRIGKPVK